MSESLIYFVQRKSDNAVKIGVSTSLANRLSTLQTRHGKLSLLGIVKGSFPREKLLHFFFRDSRIEGEFFEMTPELQEFIDKYTYLPKPKKRKAKKRRPASSGFTDFEGLIPISQAAEITGYSTDWIRKLCRCGKITCHKVGPIWLVHKPDLDAYIANPPRPGPKPGGCMSAGE